VNASARAVLAEGLGTAVLLAVVIGSGIMAQRLSAGNGGIALLANTLATVGGLYVLIEVLAPISGAHFNPAVSAVMVARGQLPPGRLVPYVVAQLLGAVLGAWLAHAMFDVAIFQWSSKVRAGWGQWIAEIVATAGLLLVILRVPASRVAIAVAAYIGAAYWFTASTSFANPAAAVGRMLTDSFAGIAPASVPAFVLAELAGAAVGLAFHIALGAPLTDGQSTAEEQPVLGRFGSLRPSRRPERVSPSSFPEQSARGR
jgi:glycerol uptake facilitator-like aquaporin